MSSAAAQAAAAQEIDYLSHAAKELRDLAPEQGEEASLAATRAFLMNAERLAQEIAAALDFVAGDAGAEVRLGSALRRLSRLPAEGKRGRRGGGNRARFRARAHPGSALGVGSSAELGSMPGRANWNRSRSACSRSVRRPANIAWRRMRLPVCAPSSKASSRPLMAAAPRWPPRKRKWRTRAALYRESAARLSARRAEAAKRLELAVAQEFAPLKLGAARFRVALTPLPEDSAGANGLERVAFEIATIEAASFGPLTRIASGGELARFALALKVALAQVSPPAVLVFDEVDRGVGGAVAAAVGERLQRLAQTMQVLLVTHSPQVAARASRHFRITRERTPPASTSFRPRSASKRSRGCCRARP